MATCAKRLQDALFNQTFHVVGKDRRTTHSLELWRCGSPLEEAKTLVRLIGKNGETPATLRQLIAVSPKEKAELAEWAASSSSGVALAIERMLAYRNAVLAAFDRLVDLHHETEPFRSNCAKTVQQ